MGVVRDDHYVIQPPTRSLIGSKAEEGLLREAECYVLASHFFWGLWAIVNAPVSSIPFGYWVDGFFFLMF